jgi:arabinofuranosyltransferase
LKENLEISDPQTRFDMGVWVGLAILSIIYGLIYSRFTQGDAYITYRYARNIAEGIGFVYNHGESVLGTTTPFYTLLLAAMALLTKLDVANISFMVCIFSLWMGSGFLYELGKTQTKVFGLTVALLYITCPFLPQFMGMESFFLLFLFIFAVWVYERKKLLLSSTICGMLILVRYEMAILVILLCIFDFARKRRFPVWIFPGLIPVLIWVIFAVITFGSPIPLSASAKLMASNTPFTLGLAGYIYSFIGRLSLWLIVIAFFFIGLFSTFSTRKFHASYFLIAIYAGVYFIVSSLIAGSFPWYYAPLIPLMAIFSAIGTVFLSRIPHLINLNDNPIAKQKTSRFLQICFATILITIQLVFWYKDAIAYRNQPFDHRFKAFTQVSEWLNSHAKQGQSIAALEIGYIGYQTNMKIIDLYGLVTPEILPWVAQGSEAGLQHSLILFSPDYVLLPIEKGHHLQIMAEDSRYQQVQTFENRYILYENSYR